MWYRKPGGVGAQSYGDMGIGCPGLLESRDVGTWGQDTQGCQGMRCRIPRALGIRLLGGKGCWCLGRRTPGAFRAWNCGNLRAVGNMGRARMFMAINAK